jgi:lipoprotein signal peptidase
MSERTYRWLFASLAVAALTADQVSKYGVFRWLCDSRYAVEAAPYTYSCSLVPGWVEVTAQYDADAAPGDGQLARLQTWSAPVMPRVNQGAMGGLGGSGRSAANRFFAVLSVAVAGILIWANRHQLWRGKRLSAALGLIFGGVLGNVYDRVVFDGVRDFLHLSRFGWPAFNVADCCLVFGVGLLVVQSVVGPPAAPAESSPDRSSLTLATSGTRR